MKSFYRIEQESVIEQLGYPNVCSNAYFKLDNPIRVEPSDTLELTNGQWFLHSQNVRVPLPGRWKSLN